MDLFPPEICDALSVLQSSVTPHSERATIKVLEKEYVTDWRNLFEQFDFVPGAIAQVTILISHCFLFDSLTSRAKYRYTKPNYKNLVDACSMMKK